jgi:signal transduction histidine kinase/ActR/RegA family two-component response regulator
MSDAKPPTLVDTRPNRRIFALAVTLCVVVAVTAYACIVFPRDHGRVAPVWLANAWVVAALLRTPRRHWPLLIGFAGLGDLIANRFAADNSAIALGLAACNLLESVACAWMVRRLSGEAFDIGRVRHLVAFVAASAVGAALSAVTATALLGLFGGDDVLGGLLVWFEADALGLLTLTPALLVLTQKGRAPIAWRETWTLAVLAIVTLGIFFVARYPALFVISAALALPTWRMGLPGAVAGCAIVAAIGTVAAFSGHGPMMIADPADQIRGLQVFLLVSLLTSVPIAVAHDASEGLQARLRAALAEARAARVEAEQAAAVKSEFLANMSHELRTPLTSVVGFTRLASEQPDLSPLSRDYIDRVSEASRALLCAVNDILDFSKLEAGQVTFRPEPVALEALTRTALDLFTPQAAAKDLVLRLEDTTPPGLLVTLDPDRLRQVLLNLVGNAVKFTAEGQVTLSAAYDEATERLSIEVRDTGPGIPPDRVDRLFKRFSQVDGSLTRGHGGTGLGLAICKGIVEAMGGEIGAASVVGEGSRFFLSVPAPRAQTATAEVVAEREPALRSGVRVLVTDDHPANRELVRLFLAGIGAEITEAEDGEAAVEAAAEHAFDVILMDLRMPKLDGIGAVTRIRGAAGPNQTTPILAFTADAESAFDDRLQALGFDGAVAKPVEPGRLIAAILSAITPADVGDAAARGAA